MAESQAATSSVQLARRWELVALIVILVVAGVLRLWRLDSVPPGLTHDEAAHGHDAVAILHGARPIYETVGYGREPLYDYVVAGLMALLGPTACVLRFSSVLFGLGTLVATFAWARLAFNSHAALAATALQAVSFWSVSTSRQGLRSSLLPALFTSAVWFYWASVSDPMRAPGRASGARPSRWAMGLFALLIGATLYTYIPARVLWVLFPIFMVYLALFHWEACRRVWAPSLVAVVVGLLLAVPLFAYLSAHPDVQQRLGMLDAPLEALLAGDVSVILSQARNCIAGFFVPGRGDDFLAYAIPGRPSFNPVTGMLFLIGVGLCLARWREPAYAFSLMWFLVGISPSLVTGASASTTRSIAAQPVAFLLPALGVGAARRWAAARWGQWAGWAVGVGFLGLVVANGVVCVRDYFATWGESPEVRAAYQHTLVETAGYLDARPEGGVVGFSTVHPRAPHSPYVFEMSLRRRDLSLRWFDGRRALLLPPEPTARLIASASAPLAPYFAGLPGLRVRERVTLRADDLNPFFLVYEWEPEAALAALRGRAQGEVAAASSDELPSLSLPVDFGGAVQLLGYDLRTPSVAPGESVGLVTLWQVTAAGPSRPRDLSDVGTELVLFSHALDAAGSVIGQEDRLDAPSWDWQAGDAIAQIHRFTIPHKLPPGPIALEVGVYRRADLTRLPVQVDGDVVGDRVILRPVGVETE